MYHMTLTRRPNPTLKAIEAKEPEPLPYATFDEALAAMQADAQKINNGSTGSKVPRSKEGPKPVNKYNTKRTETFRKKITAALKKIGRPARRKEMFEAAGIRTISYEAINSMREDGLLIIDKSGAVHLYSLTEGGQK